MTLTKKLECLLLFLLLISCGKKANLQAVTEDNGSTSAIESGDIVIISGGTVASTSTPFPLHKVSLFSSAGEFKRFIYESVSATEFLSTGDIDPVTGDFIFAVENIDRTHKVNLDNFTEDTDILDGNLSGATVKAVTVLDDGSRIIAESATVLEKFSAAGVRAGAPFPLTIPTAINNVRKISGNRFVVTFTTNPDSPRVYTAGGVLSATFASAVGACTTACDPYDVVELDDGRFVMNGRTANALYLFNSSFAYIGVLYQNTAVLQAPTSLVKLSNGNIMACNTTFNTCEQFSISGSSATRVGSTAFIDNASVMRQPTGAAVIP
jgi:hypothetical protein